MPQDNIATIKSLYAAFASGDVPFVLATLDPQIEWNEAENFMYADRNPYRGTQAVLQGVLMRIGADWNDFGAFPEELLASGDAVVALGRYRGAYKATGSKVNAQFVHVFKMRDGKVISFQQYTDTAQFRDAANRGLAAKG